MASLTVFQDKKVAVAVGRVLVEIDYYTSRVWKVQ